MFHRIIQDAKVQSSPSTSPFVSSADAHTDVCQKSVCPKSAGRQAAPWKPDTICSFFKRYFAGYARHVQTILNERVK